jgi:hypothetical protein
MIDERLARRLVAAFKPARCCEWCGKPLATYKLSNARLCNKRCGANARNAVRAERLSASRPDRACDVCGVTLNPRRKSGTFRCSEACGKRHQHVKKSARYRANGTSGYRHAKARALKLGRPVATDPNEIAAMKALYAKSYQLSCDTGAMHHVDHRIPLSRPDTPGHVLANLQVLNAIANAEKNAKVDTTELADVFDIIALS